MEYFINSTNIKNNETCIICLEKIDFKERHFLHCGHFFHCNCINKWINMDKNKCPTCKQDIECNKSFEEEHIFDTKKKENEDKKENENKDEEKESENPKESENYDFDNGDDIIEVDYDKI